MKKHPLRAKCAVGSCLQLNSFEMKKSQPAKKKLALNITSLVNLQGVNGGGVVSWLTLTTGTGTLTTSDVPSEVHQSCGGCPKSQLCL